MFIFQRINQYADSTPDSIAVICEGKEYSYAWLNRQVSLVAINLFKRGCTDKSLVGVTCERSVDYVICILAIHKLGAAFLPIDATLPLVRLEKIVTISGLEFVVSLRAGSIAYFAEQVLLSELLKPTDTPDFCCGNSCDDCLAYVIFTSGSSGVPKGVKVLQSSLVSLVENMNKRIGIKSGDVLLAQAAFNFDMSIADIFWPLAAGATLYIATENELREPQRLIALFNDKRISILQATASWYRFLLLAGWKPVRKYTVLCGGEPFPTDIQGALLNASYALWNMYGPTEAAVWVSAQKIDSVEQAVTIGKPFSKQCFEVLGGDTGELLISGSQVSTGYIGAGENDCARFNVDEKTGLRTYRTGDVVSVSSDGSLTCLGRCDRQVKLRGFRIELDEVESVISKVNGVSKAAVLLYQHDASAAAHLLAFIETPMSEELVVEDIRLVCQDTLPSYMLPDEIVKIASIPLGSSYKTDYLALKELRKKMNHKVRHSQTDIKERLDPFSLEISQLWEKHLGRPVSSLDADFFSLGGHSLSAVKIIAEIKSTYGVEISLDFFLLHPGFSEFSFSVKQIVGKFRVGESVCDFQNKSLLVPLKKGCPGVTPLYCIHGIGGGVLNYRFFADLIDDSIPVFAIQAVGLDGLSQPIATIEEMAEIYIKEIMAHQGDGLYCLCGGSMGGAIAFEMACQLQSRNKGVSSLILIDSYAPSYFQQPEFDSFFAKLFRHGRQFLHSNSDFSSFKSNLVQGLNTLASSLWVRVKGFVLKKAVKAFRYFKYPLPQQYRYEYIKSEHLSALLKHKPRQAFKGDMHLLLALESLEKNTAELDGGAWRQFVSGKVLVETLNGSHETIMENTGTAKYVAKCCMPESTP